MRLKTDVKGKIRVFFRVGFAMSATGVHKRPDNRPNFVTDIIAGQGGPSLKFQGISFCHEHNESSREKKGVKIMTGDGIPQ